MEVPSLGGSRYFVTFIDEFSNWVSIFVMKQKSEVHDCFIRYEKFAERQTGRKIKVLRSDMGGEYLSSSLTSYLKYRGTAQELTAAYTFGKQEGAQCFCGHQWCGSFMGPEQRYIPGTTDTCIPRPLVHVDPAVAQEAAGYHQAQQ